MGLIQNLTKPAMTNTGGLFLRLNIQADQPRKHKINRKPLNFKKLEPFTPYPIPTPPTKAKRAYSAITPYFRHDQQNQTRDK